MDKFYCKEYDKNGYTCEEQCESCSKADDLGEPKVYSLTEIEMETLIRCCWNNARMRESGSALDPVVYPQEKTPFKYSWPHNWSNGFLKNHPQFKLWEQTKK